MYKKEIKVLLCGSFHGNNKGDEAIAEAEILFLQKYFPGVQITVVTKNPHYFVRTYTGIDAVSVANPFAVFGALFQSTHVVIGGGGLFFEPHFGHAMNIVRNQSYVWAMLARVARTLNKEVVFLGIGVENMSSRFSEIILKNGFNAAYKIIVRDAASEHYLRHIGVRAPVCTTADSAFLFAKMCQQTPRSQQGSLRIGISLHYGISILQDTEYVHRWVADCAAALLRFADAQHKPVKWINVPMHPKDAELTERVFTILRTHDQKTEHMNMQKKPSEVIAQLATLDIQIGMRMHGAILSALAGTPFVLLSYARKVDQFMSGIAVHDPEVAQRLALLYTNIKVVDSAMQYAVLHTERIQKMQQAYVRLSSQKAADVLLETL